MKVWALPLGIALLAALGGLWLAFAQAPLATLNALAPRDGGARRVAHNAAYGEGVRRRLDVYAPARAADAPIIVFFYGGSWSSGAKDEYGFVGAALAARGFVVAIPDYRLVPDVRFPDFLENGAAAVRWTADNAAQFGANPSRIVLIGHSAGAYNAMMLALDARYLRVAGVDPTRVRGAAGLSGPYDFYPFDAPGRARRARGLRPGRRSAHHPAGAFRARRQPAPAADHWRPGHHRAPAQRPLAGRESHRRGRPGGAENLSRRRSRHDHGVAGEAAARPQPGAGRHHRLRAPRHRGAGRFRAADALGRGVQSGEAALHRMAPSDGLRRIAPQSPGAICNINGRCRLAPSPAQPPT